MGHQGRPRDPLIDEVCALLSQDSRTLFSTRKRSCCIRGEAKGDGTSHSCSEKAPSVLLSCIQFRVAHMRAMINVCHHFHITNWKLLRQGSFSPCPIADLHLQQRAMARCPMEGAMVLPRLHGVEQLAR